MSVEGHPFMSYAGGNSPNRFIEQNIAGDVPLDWDDGLLQRAQYDTSTEAHVNAIFTATLYAQYNQEHEWINALTQVDRFNASLEIRSRSPVGVSGHPSAFPVIRRRR